MKNFNKILVVFLVLFSLKTLAQNNQDTSNYGKTFDTVDDAATNWKIYEGLNEGSQITTQLSGKITEVCQAKGCWMKVALTNGSEVFVKFKDYGFFVPTDAAGNTVVMQGNASLETLSVASQRHYAKDKGASKEELAKIVKPQQTLKFIADGVAISAKH